MNIIYIFGIVTGITLITTFAMSTIVHASDNTVEPLDFRKSKLIDTSTGERKAPSSTSGNNIYVAWWTNNSANGNEEVMFRMSTDAGQTFGDKANLSNTTNSDSTRVEIDSDADSVIVTWWETNQTADTPVMRISKDNGNTFGPMLILSTNGTLTNTAKGKQ
jgi:hypothetical protein